MLNRIYNQMKVTMAKTIESLKHEFLTIRTGRASLSLLDGVKVEYYGSLLPINQVATLSIPEPRLIEIKPWDKSVIPNIEKAILKSNLNITPINDGKIVRLQIPLLTEEGRKDLVKRIKKIAEDYRVELRNIRRDFKEQIKKAKQDKEISEDDEYNAYDEVQKITDENIKEIDELTKKKEEEVMSI